MIRAAREQDGPIQNIRARREPVRLPDGVKTWITILCPMPWRANAHALLKGRIAKAVRDAELIGHRLTVRSGIQFVQNVVAELLRDHRWSDLCGQLAQIRLWIIARLDRCLHRRPGGLAGML